MNLNHIFLLLSFTSLFSTHIYSQSSFDLKISSKEYNFEDKKKTDFYKDDNKISLSIITNMFTVEIYDGTKKVEKFKKKAKEKLKNKLDYEYIVKDNKIYCLVALDRDTKILFHRIAFDLNTGDFISQETIKTIEKTQNTVSAEIVTVKGEEKRFIGRLYSNDPSNKEQMVLFDSVMNRIKSFTLDLSSKKEELLEKKETPTIVLYSFQTYY